MTPSELAQFILEVNYKNWEKQTTDNSIDDVDETALKIFLNKALKAKRMPNMNYDKLALLEKLNLLTTDKKYLNNAGRALFSNLKPLKLKMAIFATNEKRTFVDISPVEGNLFKYYEICWNEHSNTISICWSRLSCWYVII